MAAEEKWYFTKEQLANTPSRRCGFDADRELSNRQQAANFIQDMGQRLQVTQLCINTAIVYMHRFYVYHSFTHFHRNAIATAALFLAAKVEEQPRKLEHVIKVAHVCLHREAVNLDPKSDNYLEQATDLVFNENVLLQTLSFDVAIDHPHTHVVRCCHMVKASKDLAQTSYFMASNSLHLTTMCLQYKPTVVACFCIHLACKWSNWEIPQSNEGKDWFSYVDKSVTFDQLEQLTTEFLLIFDKCPTKLKRKIMSITATQNAILPAQSATGSQLFDNEPRKIPETQHSRHPLLPAPESPHDSHGRKSSSHKAPPPPPPKVVQTYDQYKEKKEKERMEREKQAQPKEHSRESHHGKPRPHPSNSHPSNSHPPGTVNPPSAPPGRGGGEAKMAPPPPSSSMYHPNRQSVSASRDQARREQAHAREMTSRDMHPQQQPSIFSPQPTVTPPPVDHPTADQNHVGAPTKNSSQEWQDKSNHSNELDANRHHSDKYSLGKDSNRIVDPALKRPHKDHRVPTADAIPKLSLEESQRLYNSKYQRKGEGDAKEGERFDAMKRPADQERHESLKRASFGSTGQPHVQKQRSDFSVNHKKDESRSAGGSNKQLPAVPPGKSQHRVPPVLNHRVPSPAAAPHSGYSQSRVAPVGPGSARVAPPLAARGATPGAPLQKPVPPNSSQHRGPSPFNPALQRPKSPRSQGQKPADVASDIKPHIAVHPGVPSIKLESRNGSVYPSEDTKRPPRDIPFRPELIKTEPIAQRSQPEIGRGLADAFRSDSLKSEEHKAIAEPLMIKVESDALGTTGGALLATPKSHANGSRSAASSSTPLSNSSRESGHTHRTPSKPASRHHTPPSANRKALPELSLTPVGPMSPPDFGSSLLPLPTTPGKQQPPTTPGSNSSSRSQHRNRTTSSSSEPELIPYMKKIEDIAGYENILDSKKGIKLLDKLPLPGRVPDMIQPIRDRIKEEAPTTLTVRPIINSVSKELKPPDLIRPFPVSQLPETFQTNSSDLGAVAFPASDRELNGAIKTEPGTLPVVYIAGAMEPEYIKTIIEPSKLLTMPSALSEESPVKSEHRHKSEKKKKKEKHKHKEKDKDKPKEERKKKHKHKDKDKHKDRELPYGSAPIKITIPKEKILSSTIDTNSAQPQGLKIKIHKDRLKVSEVSSSSCAPSLTTPVVSSGGLKLKISKDIIETYTTPMSTKESRKRERTLSKTTTTPDEVRPAKAARVDSKRPPPIVGVTAPPPSHAKPNGVRSGLHTKMDPATGMIGGKGGAAGSKPSH